MTKNIQKYNFTSKPTSSEISDINKMKIFLLTLLSDIIYFMVMISQSLNYYDFLLTLSVIIIHIIFYYNLIYKYNKDVIDIIHYFIPINVILSLGYQNKILIFISLVLITFIQIMWIIENRCILNEKQDTWGYGKITSIGTLIITILLAYKL